eukprot:8080855-Pyramimonas_sp.AAC.1
MVLTRLATRRAVVPLRPSRCRRPCAGACEAAASLASADPVSASRRPPPRRRCCAPGRRRASPLA